MKARKRLDPGAYRLPRARGIDEHAAIGMRGEDQRASVFKQRIAMARGNSDATLCVERDDRRPVERCAHMAFVPLFPTFYHFTGKTLLGSSLFPQWGQRLTGPSVS